MTKRLLVVSHAGVLGVNRVVFQNIAKVSDIDVRLIVPTRWKGDLIRDLKLERSEEDRDISIFDFPVTFSRNSSLYFYRSFLKKVTTN